MGCGCSTCTTLYFALDLTQFDNLIDQVAKDLHEGKIKASDLNQELISETYKQLEEGAANGYGKNWTNPKGMDILPNELRKNIYMFSSAKNYAQLQEINKLLVDADGKIRPFNEFSQLAKKSGERFNKNYLQAEYQTARTAAQMAEKWQKLQATKDLFPNLKFRTVGDSRVRDDHARLNGIIKPIDDKFWDRFYPPLDWRCRCDVVATAEDSTNEIEENLPTPGLKGNVGKDKEIFTKKGSFFKLLNTDENALRNAELSKYLAPNKTDKKYNFAKGTKKVNASIFADEKELDQNFEVGILICETLKFNINVRAHLDGKIIKNVKNPEYLINGKIADRKSPEGNRLSNLLRTAERQMCEIVVFDLENYTETPEFLINKIKNSFQNKENYPSIKEVIIVSKDKKTINHYFRNELKK